MLYIYACQPVLTASSTGPLSETENCGEVYGATISESTRSGIKPVRSAVVVHAAAARPAVPSVSRPSLVSCRSPLFSGTLYQTTCSLHRL